MGKEKFFTNAFKTIFSLFLLTFFATPVYAADENQSADPFARFGNYTEGSDLSINHGAWDEVLTTTVVIIPPSTRKMSRVANKPKLGTKIPRGSSSPARFESNRVVFHLLEKEHLDRVARYRKELENLPDRFPLAEFNKNEQLAYWLNLHNAVVFEQLAQRYPFSNLKKLRNGRKGRPSLWDQKLVTVEGVSMSLNDIQNNILIRHWQTPMVLYGLYQGAIGGPSLSNRAFTGRNVHGILRQKADEFINSNRGFRGTKVSLLYEWGKAAFPDWEDDLARHLISFAIPEFQTSLRSSEPFTTGLYDWNIADILGGTLSAGPKDDTLVNLLNLSHPGVNADGLSRGHSILNQLYNSNMIAPSGLTQHTINLLREVARKWEEMPEREGFVTSEECGTGPCPEYEPDEPPELEDEVTNPEGDRKD